MKHKEKLFLIQQCDTVSIILLPVLQQYIYIHVVGLEQGPLSLVSKIEELLGRNCSGSGLENREYGRGDPLR
jgi:hypothetical protein